MLSSTTRSILVLFGTPDGGSGPVMTMDMSSAPSVIYASNAIVLNGYVATHHGEVSIVVVIDWDISTLAVIVNATESTFQVRFVPANYKIQPGTHHVAFYAVDSGGGVSLPQRFATVVLDANSRSPPTSSRTRSVRPVQSSANQTPLPTGDSRQPDHNGTKLKLSGGTVAGIVVAVIAVLGLSGLLLVAVRKKRIDTALKEEIDLYSDTGVR
jgi:hypothetical protein